MKPSSLTLELLAGALLMACTEAFALVDCGGMAEFPAAVQLRVADKRLHVVVAPKDFINWETDYDGSLRARSPTFHVKTLVLDPKGEWRLLETTECSHGQSWQCQNARRGWTQRTQCPAGFRADKLTEVELMELRPELSSGVSPYLPDLEQNFACLVSGGTVWAGIEFYQGEGVEGAGGIARKAGGSEKPLIRRPDLLRYASSYPLVFSADSLWLGTWSHEECDGYPTAYGVIRYHWDRDDLTTFFEIDNAPCGNQINDAVEFLGRIWFATNKGLSIFDPVAQRWSHVALDPDSTPFAKPFSCRDIGRRFLDGPGAVTWPQWKEFYEIPHLFRLNQLDVADVIRVWGRLLDEQDADEIFDSRQNREQSWLEFWAAQAAAGNLVAQSVFSKDLIHTGDYVAALKLLERLAERNNSLALYHLALLHARGLGVKLNLAVAEQWLRKSANSGLTQAQFLLGLILIHDPVRRSEGQALLEKVAGDYNPEARRIALLMKHLRGRDADTVRKPGTANNERRKPK